MGADSRRGKELRNPGIFKNRRLGTNSALMPIQRRLVMLREKVRHCLLRLRVRFLVWSYYHHLRRHRVAL